MLAERWGFYQSRQVSRPSCKVQGADLSSELNFRIGLCEPVGIEAECRSAVKPFRVRTDQLLATERDNIPPYRIGFYYHAQQSTIVTTDSNLLRFTEPSVVAMRWLVLVTAYFTLLLFLIGVFDLLLGLWSLVVSGSFTNPLAVIELLDTVLLLLIIVEVHRTLIAYARDDPVVRIVVGAAIIAIAREIISFRVSEFETVINALTAAGGFGVLLIGLVIAYFSIRYTEIRLSGDA